MLVRVAVFACLAGTMISARASDQSFQPHVDTSVVAANITRDQIPVFTNVPYAVTIPENQPLNQSFFTVTAIDHDLQGQQNFESIGTYPADNFFDVGRLTGEVFVTRSLKEYSIGIYIYTLRVITFDDVYPNTRATADVTISVTKNPNIPQWSEPVYDRTVNEKYAMGVPVLTVLAKDLDGDTVTYRIVEDTTGSNMSGGNSRKYFFVDSRTGEVFLRKSLTEAPLDQYSFTIRATGSGTPTRSATVPVRISITHDATVP